MGENITDKFTYSIWPFVKNPVEVEEEFLKRYMEMICRKKLSVHFMGFLIVYFDFNSKICDC